MTDAPEGWGQFTQWAGPLLSDEMRLTAPVGGERDPMAGTLAASMAWRVEGGVLQIGSTDSRAAAYGGLAKIVIRGSRAHEIRPRGPWPLHFFARDGTEVYTMLVHHPGTKPNRFNIRAWENRRGEVLARFRTDVPRGVLKQLNPWRNRKI